MGGDTLAANIYTELQSNFQKRLFPFLTQMTGETSDIISEEK